MARAFLYLAFWLGALLPWPARALDRTQLAVIVNTLDPLSVRIGEYYARQRQISFQNFIKVSFLPGGTMLTREEFEAIKAQIDRQTLPEVQAYALTWAAPYRVECMSITAAIAFGFDIAFCADGCKPTQASPYFNSPSRLPFTQLKVRPAMSIAATSFEHAKALIDRGVQSDGSFPRATAYLLSTSDKARNVRSTGYPQAERMLRGRMRVLRLEQDALTDESGVLFYFTGIVNVEGLDTLTFVPGAIADHLTSAGGMLTDSSQMSALRWLEAGATGSYGTVIEPCNMPQKFPHPVLVIGRYLQGETLIEAYWKSVLMPGQGIFIGEPLAAPFRRPAASR
ncbi:MAG: TIGR03790 family protein [Sulfuricaulis sp.]|nr:TIGR03790 family protein [Sulfuricaulis sp.]